MRIAVLNASGAQARAIAAHLASDHEVVRLSRTPQPDTVAIDPTSTGSLAKAFEGCDAAVLTSPIDHRPGARETYAERVVRAAEAAGLKRLLLNTAAPVLENSDRPVSRVLKQVREIVRSGAVPVTVVQPTVYLDNIMAPWFLPGVLNEGVLAFPVAPEVEISWISHRDLAAVIGAALARPEMAGRVLDIGGPPLNGVELAHVVGAAAGRPVAFQTLPFESLAAGLNAAFGAPTGDDIADLYRHLERDPQSYRRDLAVHDSLGLTPESAWDWAARQRWSLA